MTFGHLIAMRLVRSRRALVSVAGDGTVTMWDGSALSTAARAASLELAKDAAHGLTYLTGPNSVGWVQRYVGAILSGDTLFLSHGGEPDELPSSGATKAVWLSDRPAVVMTTSGSTSVPTYVPLSDANLEANAKGIVSTLGIVEEDLIACFLPLSYSFGLSLLNSALVSGACAVITPELLSLSSIARVGKAARPTVVGLLPFMIRRLVRSGRIGGLSDDLRLVQIAGGRLEPSLQRELMKVLPPRCAIWVMYGMTECTARVSAFDLRAYPDKVGSVGLPIDGVRIRIEDSSGLPVPTGVEGYVSVSGDSVSAHFCDAEGWYRSSDVGYLDFEGFLWITGRDADFVKIGGVRMSVRPVAERLLSVSGVEAAHVCPVPDRILGERVGALVQSCTVTEAALNRAAVWTGIDRLLIPTVLRVVREVPVTSTGKIDRRKASLMLTGESR